MSAPGVITQEMRDRIGTESEPYTFEVEKGDVVRYAKAIGEGDPRFTDEAAARLMRYGGIVAPPTYLIVMRILEPHDVKLRGPYARSVDGGSHWRYFEPIRPGDRLTARVKLVDLYEREGSLGPMLFVITEITYRNQFGRVVATQRDTAIRY
jgi:acyl dehydratase